MYKRQPKGRSSSRYAIKAKVRSPPRIKPSALTSSVIETELPRRLIRVRKGRSVMPAIGARIVGESRGFPASIIMTCREYSKKVFWWTGMDELEEFSAIET